MTADLDDVRRLLALATGDEKHDESSTSTLDVLWVLYDRVLRLDPRAPGWDERDRFVLSKGHGPAAYYAVLAAKGFIDEGALATFLEHGSSLGSHPDRTLVPGVEASTGSLGHGLPIAVGIAAALRAKGRLEQRVVVLCGDAEMNEGSCWEAVMLASHLRLTNLTAVIVDNHSSDVPLRSWPEALGAFGWMVRVVGGHDRDALARALEPAGDRPLAVVADIPAGEW